ncbi:MAG: DUF2207 domain-containing protein [Flammeovirgaceae bacterium]|nr:DUF2207 domain-containing protein [Flammeovirgaceae bacterium]
MKKLAIVFLFFFWSGFSYSQEHILEFHSDIIVNLNRSLDVTEEIKVNVEGNRIQRGIFRDIPTVLIGPNSRKKRYSLDVKEVLKNGEAENFNVESINNGVRIRIGNADVFLDNGVYTYTIKYNIENQVRFFDSYDEIYWNATGNFWEFAIEKASATITLPDGAEISQFAAYSGPEGETGCGCEMEKISTNKIRFYMTQYLYSYEGMTVSVGWNKGVIAPPTQAELDQEMINDNKGLIYGTAGLLALLVYLLVAWYRVGRDPNRGTIIPQYESPKNFSPAACRYVMEMGYDPKAFTASIVNMAVKGCLTIDKSSKYFKLKKTDGSVANLSAEEKILDTNLIASKRIIELDKSYDSTLASAKTKHESTLEKELKKANFRLNYGWMVPAILLGIATFIIMISQVMMIDSDLGGGIILLSLASTIFLSMLYMGIRLLFKPGLRNKIGGIFLAGISIMIISSWTNYAIETEGFRDAMIPMIPYAGIFLSIVFLIVLFYYLIKAPTLAGRKNMDHIEGLKLFMTVAEKDRLNFLNPPKKTPQLFEKLLPYAIALNVENEWGEQFNEIIAKAIENEEYKPRWYTGPSDSMFSVNSISSSFGSSFSSAVSSGSTPPSSSSSGSSGGGSSGGGGGGGGGGGW